MTIRSIQRALAILEELNRQPFTTIANLHQRTGLPKPTLVRILQTFEASGFVEKDERLGGYQVTAMVTSLSAGYHKEPMVVEAGRSWAIAITRAHGWPVSISLFDKDAVVVRFSTVPDSTVSPFHSTVNMRLPLLTRGMGLAYLAFCPPSELETIINILRRSTNTEDSLVHDPKRLHALIESIRANGYATRCPTVEPRNSSTTAVPIYGKGDRVVASLGLTYFTSAFDSLRDACAHQVPILQKAAKEIREDLIRLSNRIGSQYPTT